MANRGDSGRKAPKRPPSKGPRRRRGGNHGNGKPIQPGKNSHTGVVFHRGPDRIARGTVESLYRTVQNDDGALAQELLSVGRRAILPMRAAVARALILGANGPVRQALEVAETIANRLEGRPVQKVVAEGSHVTVFYKAGDPPPPWVKSVPAGAGHTAESAA